MNTVQRIRKALLGCWLAVVAWDLRRAIRWAEADAAWFSAIEPTEPVKARAEANNAHRNAQELRVRLALVERSMQ